MIKRETLLTLPGFMKEYNLEVLISGDSKTRESNVEKHPQSQTKKKHQIYEFVNSESLGAILIYQT